jgi:hypothetical protein
MESLLPPNAIVKTDQIIEGPVIVKSLTTTNIVRDCVLYSPQDTCMKME